MSVCRRLAAVAFLLVLLPRAAPAMVAYTTLEHLAATSDRILVGRVEQVFQAPLGVRDAEGPESSRPCRVAEVRPIRWIKGGTGPESVFVLAEGTWTCDTSTAVPGESALLFLEAVAADRSAPTPWLGLDSIFEGLTGVSAVSRIGWSGYGRMPCLTFLGRPCVEIDTEVVRPPPGVETYPGEDPRFDVFARTMPLDDLLSAIAIRLAAIPPSVDPFRRRVEDLVGRIDAEEGDGREAEAAAEALAELGEPALAVLRSLLRDPTSPLRDGAALALLGIGDAGWRVLSADLEAPDPAARRAAAHAVRVGWLFLPEEAEGFLLERIAGAEHEVRWQILRALAMRSSDAALPSIAEALEAEDPDLAWHAAEALSCYWMPNWDWDDEPGMPEFRARAERALLALARRESVRLRRAAFRGLALVGGEASLPAIERALRDEDPVVRINAIHGLARIPTEEAAALAVALLASEDPWTRRTAAVALDALETLRR
ncbi:MAG: HEAT repeat domain-containing protein [Planctomycetes bacterium]|nr:HEAT repeat domain-containing protein [Planctomycetota bacterium]